MLAASVPDRAAGLSEEQSENARSIRGLGNLIFTEVDATRIKARLRGISFGAVVFNFPCSGNRDPKWSTTSDHILVRKFLRSAKEVLREHAPICVTTVDSPHYDGRFRPEDAAEWSGVKKMDEIPFYHHHFPGYQHVNTNDSSSAASRQDRFKTTIFEA